MTMEQMTQQITFRVTTKDVELLKSKAKEQRRSVAWIARESMRKGLEETC